MAKDFFQDIVPPSGPNGSSKSSSRQPARKLRPVPVPEPKQENATEDGSEFTDDDLGQPGVENVAPRGIRNVNIENRPRSMSPVPPSRPRMAPQPMRSLPPRPRRNFSKGWLWAVVVLCIVVIGFFGLFLFRQTTVTLTPRSQSLAFTSAAQFTAYPESIAATGTLPYTVETKTLTGSETVQGSGTTAAQMKASGTITVYNNYSTASVKLIANTRFATPSGLIFRAGAAVVVPGKNGSTPGQVQITAVADQAGPQYNIGPVARFTIPGLQSTPAMYSGVYAVSTGSMSGGFSGNQEGVAASVRSAAVADIRANIQQQATQYVQSLMSSSTVAFAQLAEVTYTDLPDTDASSSTQVQVSESAEITIPVFDAAQLASQVAQTMGVVTDNASVMLVPGAGYAAQTTDSTPVALGTAPVDFQLVGNANLVWNIDTMGLTQALAGKSQGSFQTIIATFPGIESAQARIEPFWQTTFPSNPTQIKVIVQSAGTTTSSTTQ